MENPGIRLKNLREARGLSIEELVDAIDTHPRSKEIYSLLLEWWESGHGHLWDKITNDLAKYFGVTTDYLLGL